MATRRDPVREKFWREAIAGWEVGGLTAREYCRRRGLTEASFHSWRRELRRRDDEKTQRPAGPTFVPVTVMPSATVRVEVRCPSGHIVGITDVDASALAHLFAALGPVSPC
jgi:hypothetical protein